MSSHNEPNDPNLHENWDHEHERRDVNTKSINRWMLYLLIVVIGSAFFIVWLFNQYEGAAEKRDIAKPPVADSVLLPPMPRLQANPVVNMRALRRHEDSLLSSYGIADSGLGTVRIPIDSAIEIAARGGKVPAMPAAPAGADTTGRKNDTTTNAQGTTHGNAPNTSAGSGGT